MQQNRIHHPTHSAVAANGNSPGRTLPADIMHPRTPPPSYFSVENDYLQNFQNQNLDAAFDPLDNNNHSIIAHHAIDVVPGQTVMINSQPTESCDTERVVGRMTVIVLFALCFVMIRLFMRSFF